MSHLRLVPPSGSMTKGLKVTVQFPDGKTEVYEDGNDQILLAVAKGQSPHAHAIVSCYPAFFCHAIFEMMEKNVQEAKAIVAQFIKVDLARMLGKREGGKELTLDALLGRGEDEPGGRFH